MEQGDRVIWRDQSVPDAGTVLDVDTAHGAVLIDWDHAGGQWVLVEDVSPFA